MDTTQLPQAPACPACKAPMIARVSRHGAFYGCSRYPACKEKVDAKDADKLAQAYANTAAPAMVVAQQLPPAPAVPAAVAQALAGQAAVKVPGKKMASQYAGVCACGASFQPGQAIVFHEGKVRGCPACGLGVILEQARLASLTILPSRVKEELAKLTDEQRAVAAGYAGGYARLVAAAGCHAAGQPVMLADGTVKRVEDVVVGDELMGPDSKPRRVLQLIRGRGPMRRAAPVKGAPFVVNDAHVLTLRGTTRKSARTFSRVQDVEVRAWEGWTQAEKKLWKLFRVGIELPEQPVTVDPYFLGVLLGDGALADSVAVCKFDPEIEAAVHEEAAKWGLTAHRYEGVGFTLTIPRGETFAHGNPLVAALRDLRLMGTTCDDKFVPDVYKRNSRAVRLAVLAGLIDTDGSLASGYYDFISKSPRLAHDTAWLARSVGLAAYVTPCEKFCQTGGGGTYYRVGVSGNIDVIPCRITRKKAAPRRQIKDVTNTGFTTETLPDADFYGFTLSGDGRYLLDDFTVTHNSGKTKTVATLVGNLALRGVNPKRILCMTFTRDGAHEMMARIAALFGPALQDVAVGTLHSFSGRWLGNYYRNQLQGIEAARIANVLEGRGKVDRSRFPVEVHRELPRDPEGLTVQLLGVNPIPWLKLKSPLGVDKKPTYFMAKDYLRAVGWLCANIIAPDSENVAVVEEQFELPKLGQFYALFFEALQALGVSVFDEWVYLAGKLAKESPEFVASVAANYDYCIIDEAQDNAQAQLVLAHKISAASKGNLLLVGDPAQSVYTFRGAMPEFMLDAERYVERPVKTLHLTGNFRSVKPVVDLGNLIIQGAKWNQSPPAVAVRFGSDVPPERAITVWDPIDTVDEGERVGRVAQAVMESLPPENPHPRPLAVLSRTNGGLGPSEAALLRLQIPYVISNGSGFFNRWEIRAALAHCAIAAGHLTPDVLKLATQAPQRNLGQTFAKMVLERMAQNDAEYEAQGKPIPPRTGPAVVYAMRQVMQRQSRYGSGPARAFVADIEAIINEPGIVSQVARACGYVRDHLRKKGGDNDDVDDNRLENLRVLSDVSVRFDSLAELVRYGAIGANAQTEASTPAVTLSTVHRYKGLESPGVIIVSAMVGHFPHEKANDHDGEERRIEYVAVTRARDRLVISTPAMNNRRSVTQYSWMARLARRMLKVDDEQKPRGVLERVEAAAAEKAAERELKAREKKK